MNKYLVTGGAGFIGSNFLMYMVKKYPEDEFYCLDNFTYAGNILTIKPLLEFNNFYIIVADISDKAVIEEYYSRYRFDIIINFAAESHVDRSINDASLFLKTNILGTHVLLDAARKYGCARFHQVSTDEVYGDLPLDRPDFKFNEMHDLNPSSPYSVSKAAADLLVLSYHKTYDLPITISRCSNNYGPYQYPEKLIPLMITNALKDNKLPIYGNGLNVRDWIHVLDHCNAINLILQKGIVGEVYNIGGNEEKNNISVVTDILELTGKKKNLITYVEDRKGHDRRYAIDSSKLEGLGWKRDFDFKNGLASTVIWYKQNQSWIDSLSIVSELKYGSIISGE
jgi:dTDP-glucose 4,6-dehydratase